jgi:ubiquinone biosynthesis protein
VEHWRLMAVQPQPRQRNLGRLSEIAQVAVRHGFGYFFARNRLSDLLPWTDRVETDGTEGSERGRRLREMLDELGPTFVKFGQLLSTRPDVVPPDIVAELRGLQDDVRPFPFDQVRTVIEEELGLTLEQAFLEFDQQPLAAASIGQVHRAVLPNGREVAVKVQRPNAPGKIESDLALMYQAARLVKERVRALDFIDAQGLVDEFARSIRQELDYRAEARNADQFRRNFARSDTVHIPRVYWRYTTARVLTLEFLRGVQLADLEPESRSEEERRELAYRMTDAWMTMIFRDGFFHGDPHPANILVLDDGTIGLVDFGLTGKLTDDDMAKLTRLFIDAATENVDAIPKRLWDLGVKYPKEREEEFTAELRELFYRYYGAKLSEIDPIQIIREAFALIYSMNLELPTRFVMLDKAIATLGGVGVDLYPQFNVFEVAKPYARSLMVERFRPRRLALQAQKEARELAGIARELPYQLHDILEEVRDGQIEVGFVHKGLDEFMHRIDVVMNRLVVGLVVTGGLIGSSLIGIFAENGPQIFGLHFLSVLGFLLSGVLGVWLLWGVIRSGRL